MQKLLNLYRSRQGAAVSCACEDSHFAENVFDGHFPRHPPHRSARLVQLFHREDDLLGVFEERKRGVEGCQSKEEVVSVTRVGDESVFG